ncbi:MAG: class I SAM-dependent methyltransferase [Oscillibacter sp.]|nr:class I SAM-dependent methyltransferase [Oscillibacter sp.]
MNKKVWDLYAPVYEKAMRADRKVYQYMYDRIPQVISGKEVLEIATGPGLLAKHVAGAAKRMVATDYSDGMITEAKKGDYPANLTFETADATALPYKDNSFDVVLIANALHVMPNPEKALSEIDRVLRPGGVLIAPNFVAHKGTFISRIWSGILQIAGISFEHQWSAEGYQDFLRKNGWEIQHSQEMQARIAIVYTECVRKQGEANGA